MNKVLLIVAVMAATVFGAITLTDFGDHQVFQEMVAGNGDPDTSRIRDIGVTYSTTGTYDSVCWELLNYSVDTIIDFGKFRNETTANSYTDSIQDVPAPNVSSITDTGAWYRMAVYGHTGATVDTSRGANKWGVGLCFAFWGQSNMITMSSGRNLPLPTVCYNSGKYIFKNGQFYWRQTTDDWQDTTNIDTNYTSPVPDCVNRIIENSNRLIGVCGYGKGSSTMTYVININYWASRYAADPLDTTQFSGLGLYSRLLRNTVPIKPIGFVGLQGESDAGNGVSNLWGTGFDSLKSSLKTDLGYTPKHFLIQIGNLQGSEYSDDGVRVVQYKQSQADTAPDTYLSAVTYKFKRIGDSVHFNRTGRDSVGKHAGNTIAKWINGNIAEGYRGPHITGLHFVKNGQIRVEFGLITGNKLVCDNIGQFVIKSPLFSKFFINSFELPVDSQSLLLNLSKLVSENLKDSLKWGYDRDSLIGETYMVYDNTGLPMERFLYNPITTSADSILNIKYWVGSTDSSWDSAQCWSATSGGAGGAGKPTIADIAYFDANGNTMKCVLESNAACKSLYTTTGFKKYFKDKGFTFTADTGFVFQGDSIRFDGNYTQNSGNFYVSNIKSGATSIRWWKMDFKDNVNFVCPSTTLFFGPAKIAYSGKQAIVETQAPSGGFRLLHIMGGNLHIPGYRDVVVQCDSAGITYPLDTVFGSTITGEGSGNLFIKASRYAFPSTYSIIPLATTTALSFGQTRTEGIVTSILSMDGAINQTNNTYPTNFYPASGAAFKFLTNNFDLNLSSQIIITFPATSTYQYYDFGTSTINATGLKTAGTIGLDTIDLPTVFNNTGSLVFHNSGIKLINLGTTNMIGTAPDSINVNGLSIGSVVINKSSNGTKQVGVARYIDLTMTDGTFTQQAVTDTVDATNATVNTTDAVTNVAPWNISNKLTIAAGLTLTVPKLIIGGTSGSPDTLQSGTPGSAATLDFIGNVRDTASYLYIADITLAAGDTLDLTDGTSVNGGGNSSNILWPDEGNNNQRSRVMSRRRSSDVKIPLTQ